MKSTLKLIVFSAVLLFALHVFPTEDRSFTTIYGLSESPKAIGVTIDSVAGASQDKPIQIIDGTITVRHGDGFTLFATVSLENTEEMYANKAVRWVSRNPAVVMISTAGVVIQTLPGETYIVATTEHRCFQDSVKVIVNPIHIESVSIQVEGRPVEYYALKIGNVRPFTLLPTPVYASFQDVEWSIHHLDGVENSVVTVKNGDVTAVGEGRVYLVATLIKGEFGGTHTSQVELTVSGLAVSGITLDTNAIELRVGNAFTFTKNIEPKGAADPTVIWTSNNPDVVQMIPVASTATVAASARGIGTATITATTNDGGFVATATVNVVEGPPLQCVIDFLSDGALGKVSFRTKQTWTVGNLVWSDVVLATGCDKEEYYAETDFETYGLTATTFASDCRRGTLIGEDLSFFSWCAVVSHRDVLCPDGWRVPTRDDFVILVHIMNEGQFLELEPDGTGQTFGSTEEHFALATRFFGPKWGGDRVGSIAQSGIRAFTHQWSETAGTMVFATNYWGLDQLTTTAATHLLISTTGDGFEPVRGEIRINTTGMGGNKHSARLLRCVKDK